MVFYVFFFSPLALSSFSVSVFETARIAKCAAKVNADKLMKDDEVNADLDFEVTQGID